MSEPESSLATLARIRVVLVRPSHPGNIGATARAMQTMGLSRLVLVEPRRFPDPEARALAANALQVLAAAQICASLDDALCGTVMQVAFSARSRALSHAPLSAREAAAEIMTSLALAQGDVALVFGNETYGLSNEEVMRCNRLASIATSSDSTSLNLAAAVQVATYEVRIAALEREAAAPGARAVTAGGDAEQGMSEPARHEDVERFLLHLEQSLYASGFLQQGNPRRLMERMRRLFARAGLQVEEVNILRGMLTLWDESGAAAKATAADPKAIVDRCTRK